MDIDLFQAGSWDPIFFYLDDYEPFMKFTCPNVKSILIKYFRIFNGDSEHLSNFPFVNSTEDITEYLLKIGYNVNIQDSKGRISLMLAIEEKHIEIVEILLRIGADICILNNENKSALHIALAQDRDVKNTWQILKLLFGNLQKKCSNSDEMAEKLIKADCQLYQAVLTKNIKLIKYMIEQGSSVHSMYPKTKQTSLHVAVSNNDATCVKMLLDYGADPNALDHLGNTPLLSLCKCYSQDKDEKLKVLKVLIKVFTPTPHITSRSLSSIDDILIEGRDEEIRILIQSKLATVVKKGSFNVTLLHYLAQNKNLTRKGMEEIKSIIKNYNINAFDCWSRSPLECAVLNRNIAMVQFLLEQGADPNRTKSSYATTVLVWAYDLYESEPTFHKKCAELLFQYNADPQVVYYDEFEKEFTIFDNALKTNDWKRMKSAVAQLAVIEKRGTEIIDVIYSKIYSHPLLEQYFEECRKILSREIWGSVTVFKLLTEKKKIIAGYLNNKGLLITLNRVSRKNNYRLVLRYSFYCNTLRKRIMEAIKYKQLKDKAAQVSCQILGNCLDKNHPVVSEIFDYLSDQDLQNLCKL